eukprot:6110395-Alexandrium_andersonii.AAC.1
MPSMHRTTGVSVADKAIGDQASPWGKHPTSVTGAGRYKPPNARKRRWPVHMAKRGCNTCWGMPQERSTSAPRSGQVLSKHF